VVANPRIAAGSTGGCDWRRLLRWTPSPRGPHHAPHSLRMLTPTLDIESHINAPRSAAGAEPPPTTGGAGELQRAAVSPGRCSGWLGSGLLPSAPGALHDIPHDDQQTRPVPFGKLGHRLHNALVNPVPIRPSKPDDEDPIMPCCPILCKPFM
jgi:hypothetical protein